MIRKGLEIGTPMEIRILIMIRTLTVISTGLIVKEGHL
jgi:hypothetical protein